MGMYERNQKFKEQSNQKKQELMKQLSPSFTPQITKYKGKGRSETSEFIIGGNNEGQYQSYQSGDYEERRKDFQEDYKVLEMIMYCTQNEELDNNKIQEILKRIENDNDSDESDEEESEPVSDLNQFQFGRVNQFN